MKKIENYKGWRIGYAPDTSTGNLNIMAVKGKNILVHRITQSSFPGRHENKDYETGEVTIYNISEKEFTEKIIPRELNYLKSRIDESGKKCEECGVPLRPYAQKYCLKCRKIIDRANRLKYQRSARGRYKSKKWRENNREYLKKLRNKYNWKRRKTPLTVNCVVCGKELDNSGKGGSRKYCKEHRERRKTPSYIECIKCGKTISNPHGNRKYCNECAKTNRKTPYFVKCQWCGKGKLKNYNGRRKYHPGCRRERDTRYINEKEKKRTQMWNSLPVEEKLKIGNELIKEYRKNEDIPLSGIPHEQRKKLKKLKEAQENMKLFE